MLISSDFSKLASLLVASAGGLVVFCGLWIEKDADNDREKHPSRLASAKGLIKLRSNIGWWVLMIGIAIEIGDAMWASFEAWDTRQLAIKGDPIRQPIESIHAEVFLTVSSTNFFDRALQFPLQLKRGGATLGLTGRNGSLIIIPSSEFESFPLIGENGPTNGRTFALSFKWPVADFLATATNFSYWIERKRVYYGTVG